MGVGGNAGKGAKFAGNDANRIERRLRKRSDARIGKLVGGAVEALVGVGAALEWRAEALKTRNVSSSPSASMPQASASACGLSPRLM
jgi:hypothetical protein